VIVQRTATISKSRETLHHKLCDVGFAILPTWHQNIVYLETPQPARSHPPRMTFTTLRRWQCISTLDGSAYQHLMAVHINTWWQCISTLDGSAYQHFSIKTLQGWRRRIWSQITLPGNRFRVSDLFSVQQIRKQKLTSENDVKDQSTMRQGAQTTVPISIKLLTTE